MGTDNIGGGRALRIAVETTMLAFLLVGSASALSNFGGNINGSVATGPMTWTASNFPAFWHENGMSSELLAVLQPDLNSSQRVINKKNLVYNTTHRAVMYRVSDRKGLIVENGLGGTDGFTKNAAFGSDGLNNVTGGKNYSKLGWLGQPYVAVNGQANKLSKLVLEQNETSSKTLLIGETWDMGDGWTLTAQAIDAQAIPRQVWFTLSKDNMKIDDKVLAEGQIYTFLEKSLAGESDVPVFVTYINNISAGQTSDIVELKYTWLISENVIEILAGDNFGILTVDSGGTFGFELRNYDNIILSRNAIINLLDGLNLVVNDSESLAYYPMMTSTLQPVTNNISGFKINGTNNNGSGLEGWNIKLSCTTCGTVLATTTDSKGFYKFSDLSNGTYTITEEMKTGWINNTPMSQQVIISGNDKMNVNFTNQRVPPGGSISGFKINDLNGNEMRDAGENGLSDWEIELRGIGVETKDIKRKTFTDATGFYKFDNLPAGRYLVKEKLQKGYVPTRSPVRLITLVRGENSLNNYFTNRLAVLATLSSEDIKSLYKGENALDHIAELVDLGPRVAGGDGEKKAAEYIASKMVSYGLNVTTQEFPILYFEDKGSTLQVVTGSPLNPNTLLYSPPGEFTTEIADCGLGYPENFTVCGASGKIALIQRGQLYFWQKVQNAANASALAAIIYNNVPGNFNGTLTFVTDIPAVSISDTEGAYLLELLKREPVTVHFKVDTLVQNRTSQNVIGTIKATDPEQGIVYIGGHYDSVSAGPGANDDASGSGQCWRQPGCSLIKYIELKQLLIS